MIDIATFLSFKNIESNNTNAQLENVINLLGMKKNVKYTKPVEKNNTMKKPSIQILKDRIDNKVNLILNKLSEMNFNNLLIEFVENINKITETDFNTLQQTFYIKMQSEINFVKIYLDFFKIIISLYHDTHKYNINYFYKIVETKFIHDYYNVELAPEFAFLSDFDEESKRINNHTIIRNMVNCKFFKPDILNKIDNTMVEQTYHIADIYYWFYNNVITENIKQSIIHLINNTVLPTREKVLLESLVNHKQNKTTFDEKPVNENQDNDDFKEIVHRKGYKKVEKIDTLHLEIENIIEEYLAIDSCEDIILFIDEKCKDAISKNKFCQHTFHKYFESPQETGKQILELFRLLIKKQALFKSNLSRGLLLLYSKWDEVMLDYNNANVKLKELLIYLKNNGITKNLESLLKLHKIEFSNE
jgi:hypothetical protein